jgi:hypothetical protein
VTIPRANVDDRLARSYQGASLGLPLAERLGGIHGGSLRIESEKGRGTRVIVRLPGPAVLTPPSGGFRTSIPSARRNALRRSSR